MTRRGAISLLAGAAAGVVGGCGFFGGAESYRFRMIVEADAAGGAPRSGSSVMEVTAARQVRLTDETHPVSAGLIGEAVLVDLPDGPVFVLLKERDAGPLLLSTVTKAFEPGAFPDKDREAPRAFMNAVNTLGSRSAVGRTADLPREAWPMMVRFRDLNDPNTVEEVTPEAVGIRRIRLQITRDPLVDTIDKRLSWLRGLNGLIDGASATTSSQLHNRLDSGDFRKGGKR
jgi:hypothetical protein